MNHEELIELRDTVVSILTNPLTSRMSVDVQAASIALTIDEQYHLTKKDSS